MSLLLRALGAARLYRRLMLLERRLDEPIVDIALPPGIAVRQLDLDDVVTYRAFRPGADSDAVRRRLIEGEWAFAAWRGAAIVAVGWTAPGRAPIEYLDWTMPLASDEGYSYDLYTAPAFRGHGLASAARIPAMRFARAQGCRRLLSALLPENGAGWRTPATIGFRHIGWVGYVGPAPFPPTLLSARVSRPPARAALVPAVAARRYDPPARAEPGEKRSREAAPCRRRRTSRTARIVSIAVGTIKRNAGAYCPA